MKSERVRFGRVAPRPNTREGRMLAAGALTVTVTSRKSGRHVTLRFRAKCKDAGQGRWRRCGFDEATHVFVCDFDGELVGTYYPRDGMLRFEHNVTEAMRWSAQSVLLHLAGAYPNFTGVAEMEAADFCGRCNRPLTDPESIERGLGPECFGLGTSSRHAAIRAA